MMTAELDAFPKLASAGNGIKVWNCSDYSLFRSFGANLSPCFRHVHWSPELCHFLSVPSRGDKLYLHVVKDNSLHHMDFHMKDPITIAKFSNTSSRFVGIGTKIGLIHLWDLKQKKPTKSFQTNEEVSYLHFNWNDSCIASGSSKGTITIHNSNTCQSSSPMISKGIEGISCLQFNQYKKALLVSSSNDGGIRLWDVNTNHLLQNLALHYAPATSLRFSPTTMNILITVGLDKKINVFDTHSKKVIKSIECESPLTSLDFKDDGLTIAAGSTRGRIYVYDVRAFKEPLFTVIAHKSIVATLSFQNVKSATEVKSNRSREGSSHSDFEIPFKASLDTEPSSASSRASSSFQMNAFIPARQKQSLTAEIFSPIRDFSVRSNQRLSTPLRTDLLTESPTKRICSKRSITSKKYSVDIFSPVNESEFENLDDKSKGFPDDASISYNDKPFSTIPKFDIELKQEDCLNRDEEESKIKKSESQIDPHYKSDSVETMEPINKLLFEPKGVNTRKLNTCIKTYEDSSVNDIESDMKLAYSNPQDFQAEYLRNVLVDVIEDYSDVMRKGINNFHVQVCRQFQELQDKLDALTIEIHEMKLGRTIEE